MGGVGLDRRLFCSVRAETPSSVRQKAYVRFRFSASPPGALRVEDHIGSGGNAGTAAGIHSERIHLGLRRQISMLHVLRTVEHH